MLNFWLFILLSLAVSLFVLSVLLVGRGQYLGVNVVREGEGLIHKEIQLFQSKWKQMVDRQAVKEDQNRNTFSKSSTSIQTSNSPPAKVNPVVSAIPSTVTPPTIGTATARSTVAARATVAAIDPNPQPNGNEQLLHPHHHSRHSPSQHIPMNCTISYEPTCDMYPYVRFWNQRFYPHDCYQSPLRPNPSAPLSQQKYVVFQPDGGGWNNIRMAAEVAIIFAHTTGRVLVVPPAMRFYLLDKNNNEDENLSTFDTFFDLRKIHEAVKIITMKEFLEEVASKGLLKKPLPSGSTAASLVDTVPRGRLWSYLEQACYVENWCPGKQFIGINVEKDPVTGNPVFGRFSSPKSKRMKEMIAHGRKLRPYNESLHQETAIYFPGDYRETHRILTHYYTYIYWENEHIAKIYKRIVRDRLHYHDIIFCYAGMVVRQLHQKASKYDYKPVPSAEHGNRKTLGGNTNQDATYFAFHIRRGDFQYEDTRISAEAIWNNTKHLLNQSISSLIYIATDEKNKQFFKPFLQSGYKIHFLSDYLPFLKHQNVLLQQQQRQQHHLGSKKKNDHHNLNEMKLNMNHIGMIEQVICANAHTFIGTPLSTFTGYITRMRGYYRDGRYARTYYTMKHAMYQLQKHPRIRGPFWAREFEIAHRNADDYFQK